MIVMNYGCEKSLSQRTERYITLLFISFHKTLGASWIILFCADTNLWGLTTLTLWYTAQQGTSQQTQTMMLMNINGILLSLLPLLIAALASNASKIQEITITSIEESRGGSGRGSRPSGSRPSPSYNPPTPSGPSGNYPTPSGNYPSPFTPSGPSGGHHYYPHNHRNRPHSSSNSMVCTGMNSSCTCFQGGSLPTFPFFLLFAITNPCLFDVVVC